MRFNPKARLDTSRIARRRPRPRRRRRARRRRRGIPIPGGHAGRRRHRRRDHRRAVPRADPVRGRRRRLAPAARRRRPRHAAGWPTPAATSSCKTGEDANNSADCARVAVENSLYDYWSATLPDQSGTRVPARAGRSRPSPASIGTGCGQATADVGPFYCPTDQTIYLDTTFFDDVLEQQLGGPSGDFVEPYVLAHEYGHHIQNLLGTMGQVKTQQGPTSDSVRLELQADCYAGMWAKSATTTDDADRAGADLSRSPTQDIQQAHRRGHGGRRRPDPAAVAAAGSTPSSGRTARRPSGCSGSGPATRQGTLEACDTFARRQPLSARRRRQPVSSASICGNCRCSARRCGATAGWRYFPARAPSPPATRASAHSARLRTV